MFPHGFSRNGYIRYAISGKNYSAHILVWEAFNDKVRQGYFIDHIDGNRGNNALNNLREVTQSENMYHTMENGHACQVPILETDKDGNVLREFRSVQFAADELGIYDRVEMEKIVRNHLDYLGHYYIKKEQP